MEKLIEKTYIGYCSVSISFTYSFVAKMTQNGDPQKIDYNFKKFSRKLVDRKLVDKENNGWQFGTPKNRMGVTPLTTIFQNIKDKENDPDKFRELLIYKDITPEFFSTKVVALDFKDTDDKSVNLKCDIEAYIRVFFNGSGCITFMISYKKEDLNWKIIKIILALSNRSFDNKKYSKMNDKFIYKYFIEAMERFKNDCECELYCQSLVNVDITKTENFNRPNGVSPQNPNINIVLEIDETEKFWENNSLSQNQEIANLLLNIVPEEFNSDENKKQIDRVRIPKDLRDYNGLLENLSWDNR